MKKVQLNGISEGVRYPLTTLFAQHIQEAYAEIVDALVKGLIEDPSKLTILNGCVIGGASPNFTVSAGAAYYQGEIFLVDAGTVNVPSGQTLVWRIEESYRSGDPVVFSDNIPRNAHLIRKMKLVAGASGSGVADNGVVMRLLESGSLNSMLNRVSSLEEGLHDAFQEIAAKANLAHVNSQLANKADKQYSEWADLPLLNGWLARNTSRGCQFRKNGFGQVEFKGGFTGFGSTVTSRNFAQLPPGYRPFGGSGSDSSFFAIPNASTGEIVRMSITGSGGMYLGTSSYLPQGEAFDLEGIIFYP